MDPTGPWSPGQRTDLFSDRISRPENSRPDSANRALHGLCYFLVTHAFQFTQDDRCPQILRQCANGTLYGLLQFVAERIEFLDGVPSQVWLALPYVATILAVLFSRGSRYPAAVGIPWRREVAGRA